MADPYPKLVRSVDKLLNRYGKPCEVVHSIPGGYNPGTGQVEEGVEETYTAIAVEVGYTLENLDQTLVQAGNKVGVVKITDPSFAGEVSLQMQIKLQGDKLRNLREVQPIAPGTSHLYWRFVSGS